jgi:thymidine kinase
MRARLYWKHGSMASGKSIRLLVEAHQYLENGKKVLLFTSTIDDRYAIGMITTRIGLQKDAIAISPNVNIYDIFIKENNKCKISIVLVDESQFFTKQQIIDLSRIVDDFNIDVICYGLRTDFRNELFEGSATLFAIADKIEEIKTICHCGKKATVNARIDKYGNIIYEGNQIEVGGNDRYVALCRKCWKEGRSGKYE